MGSWSRVGHPTTIPDGVDGLPHNHVITVRNRRISIDDANLVQNNVRTDTITLDLDSDWDGLGITVNLGECPSPFPLIWEGSPLTIPAAACAEVGGVDVSIVGVSSDGKTQVVTVESNSAFKVAKSGCVTSGDLPEDPTSLLGQVLAAAENANEAAESADTAATSANSAATAATSAAQSANAAATSANSAASSAASAASSANSAANAANAAAQTAIDAAGSVTGNVLVGQTGEADVASGSGAWGAKPRRLAVYGNTRQNLWVNPSGTSNGLTVTANEDGSITLSGTPTSPNQVDISTYALRPGSTYTVSKDLETTGVNFLIQSYDSGGSFLRNEVEASGWGNARTFTLHDDAAYVHFGVSAAIGQAVSGTYRVMLNEGSEAQPWCPPGLNSVGEGGSVEVVTAGKNLFQYTKQAGFFFTGGTLQAGTYTMSLESLADWWTNNGGNDRYIYYYMFDNLEAAAAAAAGSTLKGFSSEGGVNFANADVGVRSSATLTLKTSGCILFVAYYGATWIDQVTNIQLERGSTATDYEPPVVTTTPIDLQGHTLNALPDGTRDELHIDGGGNVVLEKRVGVALAPTEASSWKYTSSEARAYFVLSNPSSISGDYQKDKLLCDKLPVRTDYFLQSITEAYCRIERAYAQSPQHETASEFASAFGGAKYIYKLAEPQTIDLDAVTLPALPETFNVYVAPNANGVPATLEVEYEKDVTKAIGGLEARVAALEEAK